MPTKDAQRVGPQQNFADSTVEFCLGERKTDPVFKMALSFLSDLQSALLSAGYADVILKVKQVICLEAVFLFKCPAPGKSSWVKNVQTPHTRVIIFGQKNSMNDKKSLTRANL